jgi:hypothetical protein
MGEKMKGILTRNWIGDVEGYGPHGEVLGLTNLDAP